MAAKTKAQLEAELDALRAQNLELQQSLAAVPEKYAVVEVVEVPPKGLERSRWWTALATVLILFGAVLAPVAVVATWTTTQISNTERFVATFGPLIENQDVKDFIADEITVAVQDSLNVDELANDVFDGLQGLDLPPRALQALDLLRAPAIGGINTLIDRVVTNFVNSEAFTEIWYQALTVSHTQIVATLSGDEDAAVSIGAEGQIGIQLGPIIDAVKQRLVDAGIGFASAIPEIDKTIVIATSEAAVTAQQTYQFALLVGAWLPWVSIGLLALGVLVARRKRIALIAASVSLGVSLLVLGAGFNVARTIYLGIVAPNYIPKNAAGELYDGILAQMNGLIIAISVFAFAIALIAWLNGPSRPARGFHTLLDSTTTSLRVSAEERGVTTGRFGLWLGRARLFVLWAIAAVAFAVILFVRPVTLGLVVWTIVVALLLALLVLLLERPAPTVVVATGAPDDEAVEALVVVESESTPTGVVGAEVIEVEAEDAETPAATS